MSLSNGAATEAVLLVGEGRSVRVLSANEWRGLLKNIVDLETDPRHWEQAVRVVVEAGGEPSDNALVDGLRAPVAAQGYYNASFVWPDERGRVCLPPWAVAFVSEKRRLRITGSRFVLGLAGSGRIRSTDYPRPEVASYLARHILQG